MSYRYSPPKRIECLPWFHEKLSSTWVILSLMTKGALVLSPQLLSPLPMVTAGTPQLCGTSGVKGSPNSFTTSRLPLKTSATALNIVVYPKRTSLTLLADKTQAFETMYCLEMVPRVCPCSGKSGVTVFSLVQPKRPNHCDRAFWLKSPRSVTWFLSTVLFCAIWRLLAGVALFPGLTFACGRNASSFCDVGSRRDRSIILPVNGVAVY